MADVYASDPRFNSQEDDIVHDPHDYVQPQYHDDYVPHQNWFASRLDAVRDWWQYSSLKRRAALVGTGILVAVTVCVAVYAVATIDLPAPVPMTTVAGDSLAKPAAISAVAVMGSSAGDPAGKILEALSTSTSAIDQLKKEQAKQGALINAHTGQLKMNSEDIKSLQATQLGDPKFMKAMQEEIEKIKKIMAEPPVKLVPISSLEVPNKTS